MMSAAPPRRPSRPSASATAGDLRPSRASRRRQDRLPDEPRAVGQIGPPAFLMPSPARRQVRCTRSREAHPTTDSGSEPAALVFPYRPSASHHLESTSDHHLTHH